MNPTSIENKPRIYEVPTLLVKPQRINITPINIPENYYFQYIFKFNLNNVIDTSSCNLYPLTRKLNSSGNITYSSMSVDLNGSSYLSRDIDFDLKTLSFWFNLKYSNIDNYLLATDNNNFYIKVNSNELSIKVNTDIINITNAFIAENWYHLALTYNESESEYDIYSNNSILTEKIDNLITKPITLNIGKKSGVFGNNGVIEDINLTTITEREQHSMVAIGTNIYIFGGIDRFSYLNDFYKIDTTNNTVTQITDDGFDGIITGRVYHSMVAIETDIYIYGGSNDDDNLNDFYKIDTITGNTATQINLSGNITKRYSHSMVAIGKNIYIFGGYNYQYLNDFYKIDTTSISTDDTDTLSVNVEELTTTISERSGHSMIAINNDIYIYGGYGRFENHAYASFLNDFYKIDTTTCNVTEITATGSSITARNNHSMVKIDNDIYIFGGDNGVSYLNDFYKINTITNIVTQIALTGSNISERDSHSMVAIDGDIYIYGGENSTGNNLNDFYKITGNDSYFTGNIADLRLYNYPITTQEIQDIKLPEPTIYIQYDFDYTLDKSSSSIYDYSLTLTSNGDIQYYLSPISVYLNGISYLSIDIDFDIKSLSFWFKLENVNIDNYLLSFDNDFYIKVNSTSLEIQNDSSCNIENSFNSNIWYNLVLNYNNTDYDIHLSNIKLSETIDYKELTSFTLNIGKYSNIGFFTGNIADLRLYNYSITAEEITTIYNDSLNSMKDIIHIKTFSETIFGDTDMLNDVPKETTILNIEIDSDAILYNDKYEKGSGLYIDFNKPNLRYVGQVNITNNGKIYGRGGIGQTFSSDNRYTGRHAIKVLSDDSITRKINITNNGDGVILGGGNGGNHIHNYEITYIEKEFVERKIQWAKFAGIWNDFIEPIPDTIDGSESSYDGHNLEKNLTIAIPGINADYFGINPEDTAVDPSLISSDLYYRTPFTIPDLRTTRNVAHTTETQYDFGIFTSKWWRYYFTYTYSIVPKTNSHSIESGIHYYEKYISTGTQGFDTTKDIEVPNGFIIVNRIS
tara:strand:+ start:196 stop:3282 length:3087 start_codon:yes stop_codon:yes gene_type:complete